MLRRAAATGGAGEDGAGMGVESGEGEASGLLHVAFVLDVSRVSALSEDADIGGGGGGDGTNAARVSRLAAMASAVRYVQP
jgi:hypothetical protein